MRTLILAVVNLLAATAPAQGDIEPWRVVRDLDFRGAKAFEPTALVSALTSDSDVQKLLTGRVDKVAMTKIAAAIGRVYRRNGFADVVVTGSLRPGRGVITVEEGAQRTCGTIRCVGNTVVASAAIVEALQRRVRGFRGWQTAQPAAFEDDLLPAATGIVRQLCTAAGILDARVTVRTEVRDAVVDLVVTFADEGHRVRVQSLELVGERAAEHAAVFASLRWEPGDFVDDAWLGRMRTQFEALGRYRAIHFALPEPAPSILDPLRIEVEVLPHALPVTDVDAPAIEAVRRALSRAVDDLDRGGILRFRTSIDATVEKAGIGVLPGTVTLDLGRDGWRAAVPALAVGGHHVGALELILSPEFVSLQLGDLHVDHSFAKPQGVLATASTAFEADGTCRLNWSIEVMAQSGDPRALAIRLHPATASYCLYSPGSTFRREGDDLVLTLAGSELRIDAAGEVHGRRFDFQLDGAAQSVELVDTTILDLRQEFRARHAGPFSSAAQVVGALRRLRGDAPDLAQSAAGARTAALLRGVLTALQEFPPPEPVPAPSTRPLVGAASGGSVPVVLLTLAMQRWPGGWLADLCGAVATLSLGRTPAAGVCFANYGENEDHGPLAMLAAAQALTLSGAGDASRTFAAAARQRWGFGGVYRDLAGVLDGIPQLADLPRAIGAAWRRQEELAALFPPVAPDGDPDLAAWRAGLEDLWGSGLGESLRRLLFAGK